MIGPRLVLLVLLAIPAPAAAQADAAPAAAAAEATPVDYFTVAESDTVIRLTLTGTIEPQEVVNAGFRQGGRLTTLLVSEGEAVREGQPLARIDPLQQQQSLRVAEAALAAAQAQESVARQAAERAAAMLARGVGTRAARDAADETLASAVTAVEQAETEVSVARRAVSDTLLLAPFDGVVTAREADPGQIIGPAQPVLRLARVDTLRAVFQTPDHPRLADALGVRVTLHPIDYPQVEMTAHVTEIAPLIDPLTGSVEVRAVIDNPEAADLSLGAPVRGQMAFTAGHGIWVPAAALMRKGDQPAVWVVDTEDRVNLRPVTIDRYDTAGVCVSGGLEPGEIVVAAGAQLVYPGRRVSPARHLSGRPEDPTAGPGPGTAP